jgi:hypothetical protein
MPTPDLKGLPETPGVSPKKIVALDNAIEKWRSIVEKRMLLTKDEVAARDRVLEVMHEKGVTVYLYHDPQDADKEVRIVAAKEKVSYKNPEDNDGGEEED